MWWYFWVLSLAFFDFDSYSYCTHHWLDGIEFFGKGKPSSSELLSLNSMHPVMLIINSLALHIVH